jgi:hypothetical protein
LEGSDNITFQNRKIREFSFSLKPFPSEHLAKINYDFSKLSISEKDSVLAEYSEFTCFVFDINIDGFRGDICEYEEVKNYNYDNVINYYLFDMQKNFSLLDNNGKSTPCSIYYFERLNELAHTNRFIIGFRKEKSETTTLEYENPYFNCGKINFEIN